MRKHTSVLHYGAGVIAALSPIEVGVLIVLMFGTLEIWDAIKGNDSWWDFQEFVCSYVLTKAAVLVYALIYCGGLP